MSELMAAQVAGPMPMESDGQQWVVTWHPAGPIPRGRPHGSAGVCLGADGQLVLISPDGEHWGFPAGRPEGAETFRETLIREMREEACVEVLEARLLGYSQGECLAGPEEGLLLVRSFWLAQVAIEPWEPQFEIPHRRIVPAADAVANLHEGNEVYTRISLRALAEAGLI